MRAGIAAARAWLRRAVALCWCLHVVVPGPLAAQEPDYFIDEYVVVPDDTEFPPVPAPPPSLDRRCVVSVLNRTAPVAADGTVVLPNVPTNFGPVRARATCLVRGTTITAQSELLTVPPNGVVDIGTLQFDIAEPIPASLSITAQRPTLNVAGATSQLAATAMFADGSTRDVTTDPATTYRSSNPAIATVSPAGVVTALSGGPVIVTVLHEGVSGFVRLAVDVATGDADGDGIPDAIETANGLDPADPLDGFADPDGDGLSNKEELVDAGTDPGRPDSDGDGLSDADEVRTHRTNPLAADTDGDGVRDGLEVELGTNPREAASGDLAAALERVDVAPGRFILSINTVLGEASVDLAVTGRLRDGTTIDLTPAARGTAYTSSDIAICNFGTPAGRVFAAGNGVCTITVDTNGFSVRVPGRVETVAPQALSFIAIPGFANNVDVGGDVAYVAAGASGLQVVDVADRSAPRIVGTLDTPGNANDVRVVGTTAFVADGARGLALIDVTDPQRPAPLGTIDTPGDAQDVVVRGSLAFVADGASGLQIIDVTNPQAPALRGTLDTSGTAKGVDAVADGSLVVVADGTAGTRVVDVSAPGTPRLLGTLANGGDARDVAVQGAFAFVADFARGFTSVDFTDPAAPTARRTLPLGTGGSLMDVTTDGRLALGADVRFVNLVPIVDVGTPEAPAARTALSFASFRFDEGIGIAADAAFVYLVTALGSIAENGTVNGDARLYIGRYRTPTDTAGQAPSVQITAPAPAAVAIEGDTLPITVTATDDVAVRSVDILVDGAVAHTATVRPYQHTATVPTGVPRLTLGAEAIDYGQNLGVAAPVTVTVIPDPGTTVSGRTIDDETRQPIAGAAVTCLGITGTSDGDGAFAIPAVPTIRGNVQCSATFRDALGRVLTGSVTGAAPVRGGTTPAGDILLTVRVFFAPPQRYPTGAQPEVLELRDMNGDGVLDLLTAHQPHSTSIGDGDAVAVLLGNGNGTFGVRQLTRVVPNVSIQDVAVGDLDRDGQPDLVVSLAGGTVSVARGKGDGSFHPAQSRAAGGIGGRLAVGDLDGDGDPDVVRTNPDTTGTGNGVVTVLLGNGDGTLAAPQSFTTRPAPDPVVLGDLDADGALDLVVGTPGPVAILLGNGDGTFEAPRLSAATQPDGLATGFLDGDDRLDVVTTDANTQRVSVLLGNGDGTLAAPRHFPVAASSNVAVGDVNGDGFQDVVTAGANTSLVYVRLGDGNGTLRREQRFPGPPPGQNGGPPYDVAVGDLNGDGALDVATPGYFGNGAWVLLQQR